jgi:hypothetical protein
MVDTPTQRAVVSHIANALETEPSTAEVNSVSTKDGSVAVVDILAVSCWQG